MVLFNHFGIFPFSFAGASTDCDVEVSSKVGGGGKSSCVANKLSSKGGARARSIDNWTQFAVANHFDEYLTIERLLIEFNVQH